MTVRRQVKLNEQKQRAQSLEQTAQQRASDFIFLVSSPGLVVARVIARGFISHRRPIALSLCRSVVLS